MTGEFVERDVTDPHGIVMVKRDYWWWCVDGDPKRALFHVLGRRDTAGSPQCNWSQSIAETVGKTLGHDQRARLIQIPLAFVRWDG